MKQVEMEEFAARPERYLRGGEHLEVVHDGRVVGYYLPRPRFTPEEKREAMDRLQATIAQVLAETGMTEDELADLFDLTRPFPYDEEAMSEAGSGTSGMRIHASRR